MLIKRAPGILALAGLSRAKMRRNEFARLWSKTVLIASHLEAVKKQMALDIKIVVKNRTHPCKQRTLIPNPTTEVNIPCRI